MAQLDIDGEAAPPRSNGELIFAEPWESRAFGLCMTLYESGAFTWDEFRDQLIEAIATWERDAQPGECYSYYRCWLTALERVVVAKQLVTEEALEQRADELASRPAGYDHGHEHGDGHDHDHDH
jgi:nitrile hydratase accessory protein